VVTFLRLQQRYTNASAFRNCSRVNILRYDISVGFARLYAERDKTKGVPYGGVLRSKPRRRERARADIENRSRTEYFVIGDHRRSSNVYGPVFAVGDGKSGAIQGTRSVYRTGVNRSTFRQRRINYYFIYLYLFIIINYSTNVFPLRTNDHVVKHFVRRT